jgi:hypothetical protein
MKYAIFSEAGLPVGFFSEDVHGAKYRTVYEIAEGGVTVPVGEEPNPDCRIPAEAIEITDGQWQEFLSNPSRRRWLDGEVVSFEPLPPAVTIADYKRAFDAHLDQVAQTRQYDNRLTIAAYVSSTHPQWAAEAETFIAWRDICLMQMFSTLGAVEAGDIDPPTIEDFIADMPAIDWPA